MQTCPFIARVDMRREEDRYGNLRESVVIYATVPLDPRLPGYDAEQARAVLDVARMHKAANPGREVLVRPFTECRGGGGRTGYGSARVEYAAQNTP